MFEIVSIFTFCSLFRGGQTFVFPIQLSEDLIPQAVFYGTVVPLVLYFGIKVLIVRPFLKEQEEE
jgi:DnaJ family protein C protein 11